MTSKGAELYPIASAALDRLLGPEAKAATSAPTKFTVGPSVLRAPPPVFARQQEVEPLGAPDGEGGAATEEMLGELVDMVFVGADDPATGGHPEVHLVFKAEVLGGLHLRLRKMPDGMHATFVVEDAHAKRAVVAHIEDLVRHLQGRGFSIASHTIDVASTP